MKASETSLRAMLDGQKQYFVPLFQRSYSCQRKNWRVLWDDIMELYEADSSRTHFVGSIVTVSAGGQPESIASFTVIDGQQRLTTLSVLLAALRDFSLDIQPELAKKLEGLYLTNQFASAQDRYKVLPSQVDREAFFEIIDARAKPNPDGPMTQAYRFFQEKVAKRDEDGRYFDLQRLEETILSRLSLVSITLGRDDNAYRIFESLNYKGVPLTQADLLRNYIFMRLPQAHARGSVTGTFGSRSRTLFRIARSRISYVTSL